MSISRISGVDRKQARPTSAPVSPKKVSDQDSLVSPGRSHWRPFAWARKFPKTSCAFTFGIAAIFPVTRYHVFPESSPPAPIVSGNSIEKLKVPISVWKTLSQDEALMKELQGIPDEAVLVYNKATLDQKKNFLSNIKAYRTEFITGRYHMLKVDTLIDNLAKHDQLSKTPEERELVFEGIKVWKQMSNKKREALLDLLIQHVAHESMHPTEIHIIQQ